MPPMTETTGGNAAEEFRPEIRVVGHALLEAAVDDSA